jgi:hypothetical protein
VKAGRYFWISGPPLATRVMLQDPHMHPQVIQEQGSLAVMMAH